MKIKNDIPPKVKPFVSHGASMEKTGGDWIGDCLFCGKEQHFYVNQETGQYDCKVCTTSGNIVTFLTNLHAMRLKQTTRQHRIKLRKDRGLPGGIIQDAKVAYDGIMRKWLIPCFSKNGTIHDIRRYDPKAKAKKNKKKKNAMMGTGGCENQLWGMAELQAADRGSQVWLCEGEWDGMAAKWLLRELGITNITVVAVPGSGILKKDWLTAFAEMKVWAFYDNDDSGDKGSAKAAKKLANYAKEIKFCWWPDIKPTHYDLRDYAIETIGNGMSAEEALAQLESTTHDTPRHATAAEAGLSEEEIPEAALNLPPLQDMDFPELLEKFSEYMLMNEDLKLALKLSVATVMSTDIDGDPLWIYIVGPPSSGKTMILSPFQATNRVIFKSRISHQQLISGWKEGKDPSLIPQLSGLTLVLKDFTEVIAMPEMLQEQVFSTLRGAYDGFVDVAFGNNVVRKYNRHSDPPFYGFSMLAAVTNMIHGHKKASLGERFLKFQLNAVDEETAEAISLSALASIGKQVEQEGELQWAVACHLQKRLDVENLPAFPPEMALRLHSLVQLVAAMRATVDRDRYSEEMLYKPVPESGTRLIKQLGKLGITLAALEGKKRVTEQEFKIIERVATDTAYGFHLDIINAMMEVGGAATKTEVATRIDVSTPTIFRRFKDLEDLKIIRKTTESKRQAVGAGKPASVFRVATGIYKLWKKARGQECLTIGEKQNSSENSTSRPILPSRKRSKKKSRSKRANA